MTDAKTTQSYWWPAFNFAPNSTHVFVFEKKLRTLGVGIAWNPSSTHTERERGREDTMYVVDTVINVHVN